MPEVKLLGPLTLALVAAAALALCSSALALGGAAPLVTKGSTALGSAAQGRKSVTLTLAPRNEAALRALSAGATPITPAQFMSTYAPSTGTVAAISSWASAHGLRVSSMSADRELVKLTGSTTALGSALGVGFERYRAADGSEYTATTGTASLPAALAPDVVSITGLSSLARAQTQPLARPAEEKPVIEGVDYPGSYDPEQLWAQYHASSKYIGKHEGVSIITAGDLEGVEADLRTFEQKFDLPEVKWKQIIVGAPGTETEGNDEWDLDTQYSTGMAPGVKKLFVYTGATLEDEAIEETVDRWVTEDKTTQASFSAGECETLAKVAGFMESLDTILSEAAAEGRTMFASAGDTGSQCSAVIGENGVPAGITDVEYPASSPYAIGVGGTSILSPEEEIGWYSGGGGTSLYEEVPSWQKNVGGSFTGGTSGFRGVPDVAFDADPESGVEVIIAGKEEVIGGTSVGAPSWNGIWARVAGAAKKKTARIGFGGPVIYEVEPEAAFYDITLGTNTAYPVTPGYDYVTGRGTPELGKLAEVVAPAKKKH